LRQYRPQKADGDELEEVCNGADGKEYTTHQTMRRLYDLKPYKATHITAISLDHFGLRVMIDPLMNEEEINLEENMPDKNRNLKSNK
jgi:hypothetical protein